MISGVGGSVNGYNLFAYCMNNPVNMTDSSGQWPKFIKNAVAVVKSIVTIVAKAIVALKVAPAKTIAKSSSSMHSLANHVTKASVKTPSAMLNGGPLIGKVGFSSTKTEQNKEPGLFYSYSEINNYASKVGAGINAGGWLGVVLGTSTEGNVFAGAQVTPWLHAEALIGFDGLGLVLGGDDNKNNISYDFEVKCGWGLIAIFVVPFLTPSSSDQPVPAY